MIFKMSHRENNDTNKQKVNGLSNHNNEETHDELDVDATLTALLASSLISPDAGNLEDISQIAGEYSSLNNTIDELNKYLDRWDERHDQLRAHIREAIKADNEEDLEENDKETSSSRTVPEEDLKVGTRDNKNESVIKEEQSENNSDKSI